MTLTENPTRAWLGTMPRRPTYNGTTVPTLVQLQGNAAGAEEIKGINDVWAMWREYCVRTHGDCKELIPMVCPEWGPPRPASGFKEIPIDIPELE